MSEIVKMSATVNKSRNSKEYMRNYMREYYKKDPLKSRKYRLSCKTKKDYNINEKVIEKYKEDIHHIVKIKHLMSELNADSLIHFINEHSSLTFEKKTTESREDDEQTTEIVLEKQKEIIVQTTSEHWLVTINGTKYWTTDEHEQNGDVYAYDGKDEDGDPAPGNKIGTLVEGKLILT